MPLHLTSKERTTIATILALLLLGLLGMAVLRDDTPDPPPLASKPVDRPER